MDRLTASRQSLLRIRSESVNSRRKGRRLHVWPRSLQMMRLIQEKVCWVQESCIDSILNEQHQNSVPGHIQ